MRLTYDTSHIAYLAVISDLKSEKRIKPVTNWHFVPEPHGPCFRRARGVEARAHSARLGGGQRAWSVEEAGWVSAMHMHGVHGMHGMHGMHGIRKTKNRRERNGETGIICRYPTSLHRLGRTRKCHALHITYLARPQFLRYISVDVSP